MSEPNQNKEHRVIIGLGSNISPEQNLPKALSILKRSISIVQISSAWRTQAVGSPGPDFLNAAVLATTPLSITQLRTQILRPIENSLGRIRTKDPNAPRTIDLDVLIFDDELIDPDLWDYAHMSVPVAELIPDYTNPVTGESLVSLSERLVKSPLINKSDLELHRASATGDVI